MRRWLRDAAPLHLAAFVLSVAGIAISSYLTAVHFQPELLTCSVGGCETVQSSRYAELAGIPIAILGLGMYVVLAAASVFRLARPEHAPALTNVTFAMTLAGSLYAVYLTYIEVALIDAICQWCVLFAVVTWAFLLVEGAQIVTEVMHPREDQDHAVS